MIEIFIPVVNRTDFLIKQIQLFSKYFNSDYKLNIVIDTNDKEMIDNFLNICSKKKITFFKKPFRNISDPAYACEDTIEWILNELIYTTYNKSKVLILDSDMFLINFFDFKNYLSNFKIIGVIQNRKHIRYLWNGIIFLNMQELIKFDDRISFKIIKNKNIKTDVGGESYYFLNKHKNVLTKIIDVEYPIKYKDIDLIESNENYNFELLLNKTFLHYRAGSNWFSIFWKKKKEPLKKKLEIFEKIYKDAIDKNITNEFLCSKSNDKIVIKDSLLKKLILKIIRIVS
ncbi:MAG: hypothetical protein ACJ0RK_00415 [Alphaproteobacteria bacterium]